MRGVVLIIVPLLSFNLSPLHSEYFEALERETRERDALAVLGRLINESTDMESSNLPLAAFGLTFAPESRLDS